MAKQNLLNLHEFRLCFWNQAVTAYEQYDLWIIHVRIASMSNASNI